MKFFTLSALLAAALFSAVVVVPFLPAAKARYEKTRPNLFMLEARLSSSAPGHIQVYYDDGSGFTEAASSRATVAAGTEAAAYRLPLPPGNYRALRFDPLDREGSIRLVGLRVISQTGRVLYHLAIDDFKPTNQIQSLQRRGAALEIVTTRGADDPQLTLTFNSPLAVHLSWGEFSQGWWPRGLTVFVVLAAALFAADRAHRLRTAIGGGLRRLAARPVWAVSLTAALAVVASAYPIVFLGKSYVSPNLGTVLLYDDYPTLPGYQNGATVDVKLSDIGAVMWQHVPFSMIQHRALAQGELPLWNRYNSAGTPLLAQGQSMFGDPMHLLVVAANGAAWAWDLKYLIAKWLFAAGLGLTVLAVSRHLSAALIVGAAAPFIGFFLYRINHPAFFSLCYAPWPLYCCIRVAQAASRRGLALWAAGLVVANIALMNSGTVKEAYMLLLCMNFSGGCVLLFRDTTWRERLAKLAVVAWAGVLFVLLTAPVWATFLHTLKNAYTGYNVVTAYQIQPSLLLGAFDEIFYRPLMTEDRVFSPSLNFLLLLGLLYFLATLRLHFANRAAVALAASSLLPLSLAFGLISPRWVVTLPFLGNVSHLDNTFSCVLIVLWSVLAGVGFAQAATRLGTRKGRGDLIVAGLLLFALVFGWVAFGQAAHRPILGPTFTVNQPGQTLPVSEFIWNYLAVLVVAALVLAGLAQRSFARSTVTAARGLLLALCAVVMLWRHGLHASAVGFETYTGRPTERVDFHAKSEAMQFVRAAQAREPTRGFGLHGNFFPGWTGVYGLETVHGPDALVNPYLRELIGASGVERAWDWRLYVDASSIGDARPVLDALNVRYYFDRRSDQGVLGRHLHLVKPADLDIYESPRAWPRAFFTDRIDAYDQPAEFIQKIRTGDGRPFVAAQRSDLARERALAALPRDLAGRAVVAASNYRLTENTTSFSVRADGPGVIALIETWWPDDFRAELNGHRAAVVRLNHAFKGVVVDAAGEYRVTFRYWPKDFSRDLTLSAIGAVLLALSLFVGLRRPRRA